MLRSENYVTLNQAAERLGAYYLIVRRLIEHEGIPLRKIGNCLVLDGDGFKRLARAYEGWRNRPQHTSKRCKPTTEAARTP
jgi:hypothetical protein